MKKTIFTIVFLLVLAAGQLTAGIGQAQGGQLYLPIMNNAPTISMNTIDILPTWEEVLKPGAVGFDGEYRILAIEKFRNRLFAAVSSGSGGQIFSSTDGSNWQPMTDKGFNQGVVEDALCYWGVTEQNDAYDAAYDMVVFQDRLYVAPIDDCYGRTGKILRTLDGTTWEDVSQADFHGPGYAGQFQTFAVFQGMIYASQDYDELHIKIWRSATGAAGTWESVADLVDWAFPGSFYVFKNALYLISNWVVKFDAEGNMIPTDQIWRSFDGVNWEMVVSDGFGEIGWWAGGGLADYRGYLYVGMGDDVKRGSLYRTLDGVNWETVVTGGFGNPNNGKIAGVVAYGGDLYVATLNFVEGCQVYRSHNGLTGWEQVNETGWGDPTNFTSQVTAAQVVFKGNLYMGALGVHGGLWKMSYK